VSDEAGLRRCPVCRRVDRPFGRAVAFGSYEEGLRELIHLLKYSGVRPAAGSLGQMLAGPIAALVPEFAQPSVLVIPVPLYKGKSRQRGFNQAELIARAALKACGSGRLQLATDVLVRTRDTKSQIGLTGHERRAHLRGAFAVPRTPKSLAVRFCWWMMFTPPGPRFRNAPECCAAPAPPRSGWRRWPAP